MPLELPTHPVSLCGRLQLVRLFEGGDAGFTGACMVREIEARNSQQRLYSKINVASGALNNRFVQYFGGTHSPVRAK